MLANTCLADNLSTLSTFNWGKLQLLNVDFFVYIKLSTFLCQKAVSPYISTLSCVFHQMAFLWKLFLSTLSTFLKTLDFTGFLGFFPSAIYKIINSILSCQSTDFFDLVTLERSPNWGMLCCHL